MSFYQSQNGLKRIEVTRLGPVVEYRVGRRFGLTWIFPDNARWGKMKKAELDAEWVRVDGGDNDDKT